MSQRRLALHASALSDAEYAVYTASLKDLVLGDSDAHEDQGEDDEYFARMQMGVREARAWLRGRYADVPVQTIDAILRFFSPSLAPGDTMAGTEFFAALRLVVHASNGTMSAQDIDRGMAFVQADPTVTHSQPHTLTPASRSTSTPSSRAQSPSKRYNPFAQAQPPQPPQHHQHPQNLQHIPHPPLHPSHPSLAHTRAQSSYRGDSAPSVSRSHGQGQGSERSQSRSQTQSHNPFTTVHTVPIASSSAAFSTPTPGSSAGPPQIPPRKPTISTSKPASEGTAALHAPQSLPPSSTSAVTSTSMASKRKSAPPVPPPRRGDRDRSISPTKLGVNQNTRAAPPSLPSYPSSSTLPLQAKLTPSAAASTHQPAHQIQHITTPLMRQSLHASQIGQSLQKAEARMEKERVMQVLRTSAGPSGSNSAADTAVQEDRERAPPLPQRRPSGRVAPPPPAPGSKPIPGKSRQQLPSPPSSMGSMGSMGSLEKVALAGDLEQRDRERERERLSSRSPTKPPPPPPPPHPQRRRETVSSVGSAEAGGSASESTSTPSRPPPTHPDRAKRNLESFEAVYGPTLAFPVHPDLSSTSTPPSRDQARAVRSPFSPISPIPGSPSASPSPSSRYGHDALTSGSGPATPPGVFPRVFRSKSMHHKPPPPAYGAGTTIPSEDAASASPFASSSSSSSSTAAHSLNRTSHASPAPPPRPPARKKRPESFQVLPSSSGPGGPFGLVSPSTGTMNAYGVVAAAGYGSSTKDIPARGGMGYVPPAKPFNAFGATTSTTPVRRSSLSLSVTPTPTPGSPSHSEKTKTRGEGEHGDFAADRDRDSSDVFAALAKDPTSSKDRPNPIAGLKNTFASANAALMPTLERAREGLDKARYKAEAGLSRRGYMRHNVGYGYASGGGKGHGSSGDDDDETQVSDARGRAGYGDEDHDEGMHRAMGGLSIARERERDRTRERQEMAGLVGGVDGRMKAPSSQSKKGRSRDVDRDPAAATSRTKYGSGSAYGYGLERDWNSDEDRPSVDAGPNVDSDDDGRELGGRPRRLGTEKDSLKWPAGEGWKPL